MSSRPGRGEDRVDLVGPAEADDRAVDRRVASVQATATAPGVVPCRSATALQPLDEREVARQLRLAEARVVLAPVVLGQALDPLARHPPVSRPEPIGE